MSTSFLCPVCGSKECSPPKKYIALTKYFTGLGIVRCAGCGLYLSNPMPSDKALDAYYRLYWKDRGVDHGLLSLFTAQTQSRVKFLKPFVADRGSLRVLDIGAGFGPIAPALRQALPQAEIIYDAVETDPAGLAYLREHAGARAVYAHLKDAQGEYDLVVLTHVLEHIPDPLAFLKAAAARIVPDGLVLAESPNMDFTYKAQNEPHVVFFSIDTMKGLAVQAGLQVTGCETCGHSILRLKLRRAFSTFKKTIKAYIRRSEAGTGAKQLPQVMGARASTVGTSRDVRYVFKTGGDRAAVRIVARKIS